MDVTFLCHDCHRKFPCNSSLMSRRRMHCKRCLEKGSVLAIRKWDESTTGSKCVSPLNREPREPLHLNEQQWGLVTGPTQLTASCSGIAVDKIVKQAKAQAAQGELEKVGLSMKN